jgi:hypothetical protein
MHRRRTKSLKNKNNMKLEQQVCNLELAKRLKELGVKQESLFWWVQQVDEVPSKSGRHLPTYRPVDSWVVLDRLGEHGQKSIAALTVAELGELLPYTIDNGRQLFNLQMFKCTGNFRDESRYSLEYNSILKDKNGAYEMEVQRGDESEADARAKMLIYLLENKLITLP